MAKCAPLAVFTFGFLQFRVIVICSPSIERCSGHWEMLTIFYYGWGDTQACFKNTLQWSFLIHQCSTPDYCVPLPIFSCACKFFKYNCNQQGTIRVCCPSQGQQPTHIISIALWNALKLFISLFGFGNFISACMWALTILWS